MTTVDFETATQVAKELHEGLWQKIITVKLPEATFLRPEKALDLTWHN